MDDPRLEIERITTADEATDSFAFPARVRALENVDELRARLRQVAPDPSVFEDNPPYFWSAEISSTRRDSFFTMMDVSTLRNFAAEAAEGRAFLDSHNIKESPIGYSLDGRFISGSGNGIARVEADYYTMRDAEDPDAPTNRLIKRIRSGIQRDVSVGFHLDEDGEYRCTLCDRNMFDLECRHVPGLKYQEQGSDERRTAMAWIRNGHLNETSGVYDGSTPNATILKAQRMADAGRLKPEAARVLEARYRIKLPAAAHNWRGVEIAPGSTALTQRGSPAAAADSTEETRMPDNTEQTTESQQQQQTVGEAMLTAMTREMGLNGDADPLAALRSLKAEAERAAALAAEVERLKPLEAEVQRLTPLADDGKTYRGDLITQALEEGVRAFGNEFRADTYRAMLETAPLDTIKTMRDDWGRIAGATFPGGRVTLDKPETDSNGDRRSAAETDNRAYRVP